VKKVLARIARRGTFNTIGGANYRRGTRDVRKVPDLIYSERGDSFVPHHKMKSPRVVVACDKSYQTQNSRDTNFSSQLSASALKDFDVLKSVAACPRNSVLFMQEEASRGIYLLCQGEVKISISSREGKTLTLRIAKPGEILGLASAFSSEPYEVTAETTRPSQVAFVNRAAFLRFLAQHSEAYRIVARQLGSHYHAACRQLRTVTLSKNTSEKVADLLMGFAIEGEETEDGTRVKLPFTHEEIAEFGGMSRESVSRVLSEFKDRNLIVLQGSSLLIRKRLGVKAAESRCV
jgi:CRP/FNR family cyclic AMP-dependent transcriptional regulator